MDAVQSVDGKVESIPSLRVRRVETPEEVRLLMPAIAKNELLTKYVLKRFADPDTLILRYGKSCMVVSILEHDFFGKVGLIAWAQNPDHFPAKEALWIAEKWSQDKGATQMVAFVGEEGPFDRPKAFARLTGMRPFRLVFGKEIE